MRGKEHGTEYDAKTTHDKIGNAEERILASHDGAC
jgi:hypothetical protein